MIETTLVSYDDGTIEIGLTRQDRQYRLLILLFQPLYSPFRIFADARPWRSSYSACGRCNNYSIASWTDYNGGQDIDIIDHAPRSSLSKSRPFSCPSCPSPFRPFCHATLVSFGKAALPAAIPCLEKGAAKPYVFHPAS